MLSRWYPPLTPAEKPALLDAIASCWGCDDPDVALTCRELILTKKAVEETVRRFLEKKRPRAQS